MVCSASVQTHQRGFIDSGQNNFTLLMIRSFTTGKKYQTLDDNLYVA
jgi:hypothetical protein